MQKSLRVMYWRNISVFFDSSFNSDMVDNLYDNGPSLGSAVWQGKWPWPLIGQWVKYLHGRYRISRSVKVDLKVMKKSLDYFFFFNQLKRTPNGVFLQPLFLHLIHFYAFSLCSWRRKIMFHTNHNCNVTYILLCCIKKKTPQY